MRSCVCCAVVIACASGGAFSADISVPGDFGSIQAAIDAANDGDTVLIAPGTYTEALTLSFGKRVSLHADGPAGSVIFDGSSQPTNLPILTIRFVGSSSSDDPFSVRGIVFRGGVFNTPNPDYNVVGGAAVSMIEGGTRFIDCTFENNTGIDGGAISVAGEFSFADYINCVFRNNTATDEGGAAYFDASNLQEFEGCVFEDNQAGTFGGAIAADELRDELFIQGSRFSRNSAPGAGGAVYVSDGGDYFSERNVYESNTSAAGGAIAIDDASLIIFQDAYTGNTATDGGGVRAGFFTNAILFQATFDSNSSTSGGDDLTVVASASVAVTNSVFNSPSPILDNIGAATLVGTSLVRGGFPGGTEIIDADPMFVSALGADGVPGTGDEDFTPAAGSPLIDAADLSQFPVDFDDLDGDGDSLEPYPFDLLGNERLVDDPDVPNALPGVGRILDIGAVERDPNAAGCPADFTGDGSADFFDVQEFLAAFSAMDPAADITGDGEFTFFDIQEFLALFAAGCP